MKEFFTPLVEEFPLLQNQFVFFLFVCSLFNGAFSYSDYIASAAGVISE
jgi:hypothetical protein